MNKVQEHQPSNIGIAVIHNKIKVKKGILPESVNYICGSNIGDEWIIYPWDDSN